MANTDKIIVRIKDLHLDNVPVMITANKKQFEKNCKAEFKQKILEGNVFVIEKHEKLVGKTLYKVKGSFNYKEEQVLKGLNITEPTPIVFTFGLFDEYVINLINNWIKQLSNRLLTEPLVCNSTCALSNIVFGWDLECKQDLIGFYKQLVTL